MNKQQSIDIVRSTFESPFEKKRFITFIRELLNHPTDAPFTRQGNLVPDQFKPYISHYERVGKYITGEHRIDILIVYLKKGSSIAHARSMQRNFISGYLQGKYGTDPVKDAALVAFVSPDTSDWRFSLVRMEYKLEETAKGGMRAKEEYSPARRWSFLVGPNEKSHTAQSRLVPIIADDDRDPTLAQLEDAFNIEKVTKEFFEKYRNLFIWAKEELDRVLLASPRIQEDFKSKNINTVDLAKKLLGQIIFLYYLQKKGWFGVPIDADWGEGSKTFLRELFEKKHGDYKNFFNDILEPLFYEALRMDRSYDGHYYSRFNCKIPFLNGGLFDPMNNYDWVKTDILLSNELFSNKNKTPEGDTGNGILDIFDRYNFTVKEDEPFEKEVAIDPELLGKAYEKFNAIRPDNYEEYLHALKSGKKGEESKFNKQYGVYYTPREIVHYMCQQSLINYLYTELNANIAYQKLDEQQLDAFGNATKSGQLDLVIEHHAAKEEIAKDDIETLILNGDSIKEHDTRVMAEGRETRDYPFLMPEAIRRNSTVIDNKLASIKVCDPAVGSGAFPVGMMSEIVKARAVLSIYQQTFESEFISITQKSYKFKRDCIENSLYGVDIDLGAIEISKLRLWLSLVVDEDDPQNIKPLPNLDYKVVCGNSIIGFPFKSQRITAIEQLKKKFITETRFSEKMTLKKQIDQLLDEAFSFSRKSLGYEVKFDFKVNFSEVFRDGKGFDIVIANPPYIGESGNKEKFRDVKQSILKEYYLGKMDYFYFFIHLALNISDYNSQIAFITTNYYLTATGAKKLRSHIKHKSAIARLVNFNELKIFEAAQGQHNLITLLTKGEPIQDVEIVSTKRNGAADSRLLQRILSGKDSETEYYKVTLNNLYDGDDNYIRFFSKVTNTGVSNPAESIVNKLKANSVFLGLIAEIDQGIVSGCDYVSSRNIDRLPKNDVEINDGIFVFDLQNPNDVNVMSFFNKEEKELLRPFYKNSDISRYWCSAVPNKFILYIDRNKSDLSKFPNVLRHLNKFKSLLDTRREVENGRIKYFQLQWPRSENTFLGEKIIVPYRSSINSFALTTLPWFCRSDCYIIKTKSENFENKYLLALLNSRLYYFWFYTNGKRKGEVLELFQVPLSEVPLKIVSNDRRKVIIKLVNQILQSKESNPKTDTSSLEAEINRQIYEVYGLTEDEIKIVEGE